MTPAEISRGRCPECDGNGWTVITVPRCCGRSDWECGASGCTGPDPHQEQEQCPHCQGTGQLQERNQ